MDDAIVIGAGLFGQIITKALRAQGRKVTMVDSGKPLAGSKPAACLMKPSWFSSLGKDVYEPSLMLLDQLYGVEDVVFQTRPKLTKAKVHWIQPSKILSGKTLNAEVIGIGNGYVVLGNGARLEAPLIIVAAGIWTEKLLPEHKQVGQQGVAFLWDDRKLGDPFIAPWAPYRQMVGFDRGDGYWFSDGTAIKQENWTLERESKSWDRAVKAVCPRGFPRPKTLLGVRPYAKGRKPCMLEEVEPGLWVASGGAKNGTLAAGYCAHIILERTS